MRGFGKFLIGSALAATMVVGGSASARPWGYGGYGGGYSRHYHRNHGDGFGNFLLGAGVVGLIAAVAANAQPRGETVYVDRDDPPPAPVYEDDYPPPPPPPPVYREPVRPQANYDGGSRDRDAAVDVCKVAAEREGEKYSSRVRVDTIEDVRGQREGGYRVTGVVAIDKAGYNGGRQADVEHSRFDCTAAGGRVVAFRLGSSAEMAQRY